MVCLGLFYSCGEWIFIHHTLNVLCNYNVSRSNLQFLSNNFDVKTHNISQLQSVFSLRAPNHDMTD